jgi:hypothetical protein
VENEILENISEASKGRDHLRVLGVDGGMI